jgi:hypothetical protein
LRAILDSFSRISPSSITLHDDLTQLVAFRTAEPGDSVRVNTETVSSFHHLSLLGLKEFPSCLHRHSALSRASSRRLQPGCGPQKLYATVSLARVTLYW